LQDVKVIIIVNKRKSYLGIGKRGSSSSGFTRIKRIKSSSKRL